MKQATIPGLNVQIESKGNHACLTLEGECDMATLPAFTQTIRGLGVRKVVVDLSGLTFLDSSGIGALLWAKECMEDRGGTFRIRGAAGVVQRVMEITGTYDVLRTA